ncbi:recombinase family protein [Micromonospora violae]|uniref:recombinase family protein n=1 Tax=Micromonospora violae TaxID=1278207 RepID=UPI001FC9DF64|nr:recombinase family protein [Micromonospora violae]
MAAILANPRYTGRQVWNRQHTDRGPLDAADDLLGRSEVRRWSLVQQWVISRDIAHPPLVSEHDLIAAQQANALQRLHPRNQSDHTTRRMGSASRPPTPMPSQTHYSSTICTSPAQSAEH